MANNMTKRDRDVLNFIKAYMLEMGTVPSYREIGEGVQIHNTKTMTKHMQRLIELGEVIPVKKRAHTYAVKGMKYVEEVQRG